MSGLEDAVYSNIYPNPSSLNSLSSISSKPDQTLNIVVIVIILLVVVGLLVALVVLPCMNDDSKVNDLSEIKDDLDEINKKLPVRMEAPTNPTSIIPVGTSLEKHIEAHGQFRQIVTSREGKFPNTDTRSMIYRQLDCVKDNIELADEYVQNHAPPTWGRSN
jgi:hypothetical protein